MGVCDANLHCWLFIFGMVTVNIYPATSFQSTRIYPGECSCLWTYFLCRYVFTLFLLLCTPSILRVSVLAVMLHNRREGRRERPIPWTMDNAVVQFAKHNECTLCFLLLSGHFISSSAFHISMPNSIIYCPILERILWIVQQNITQFWTIPGIQEQWQLLWNWISKMGRRGTYIQWRR